MNDVNKFTFDFFENFNRNLLKYHLETGEMEKKHEEMVENEVNQKLLTESE